jgi:NADH:ubiquinone oxidoreductase subunit 6 (subunit J)
MFFSNVVSFLILVGVLLIAFGVYHILIEVWYHNKKNKKNISKCKMIAKTFAMHFVIIFIFASFLVPVMLWLIRNFHP